MEYINNMVKKTNKEKILNEVDRCWGERDGQYPDDAVQITLSDVLREDRDTFCKNILWVGRKKEMHPYFYVEMDNNEIILLNYPYQEINIKAFRDGELYYQNQSLRILN